MSIDGTVSQLCATIDISNWNIGSTTPVNFKGATTIVFVGSLAGTPTFSIADANDGQFFVIVNNTAQDIILITQIYEIGTTTKWDVVEDDQRTITAGSSGKYVFYLWTNDFGISSGYVDLF